MSIVYLVLNACSDFEAGTLLRHDNGKLIDLDNTDTSFDFNDQIIKDWKQLEENSISRMKKMSKSERLSTNLNTLIGDSDELKDKVPTPPQETIQNSEMDLTEPSETGDDEGIKYHSSYIFIRPESNLDDCKTEDKCVNMEFQLVKIRWKTDIYGLWIKSFTVNGQKYAAIALLPCSKILIDDIPECVFKDKYFEKDDTGVIVDQQYVEVVEKNLVFIKDSSIINEDFRFKLDDCTCKEFSKGEYVKFKHDKKNRIGVVEGCCKINYQHCLQLKLLHPITENQIDMCYVRVEDVVTTRLGKLIKYCEGVIVEPSSVLTVVDSALDHIHVNDKVNVTLRDSCEIYECTVVWLGRMNEVEVAAVILNTVTNVKTLENLMSDGLICGKQLFHTKSFIVSLSAVKKIVVEENIEDRIKEIIGSLKNNDGEVTKKLYDELQFILGNIGSVLTSKTDCLTHILKMCSNILKSLKRKLILKFDNASPDTAIVIEEKDQLLLDCSVVALNIICDLCSVSGQTTKVVSMNHPFMEIVEQLFNKLSGSSYKVTEIKTILANIMFIFWNIVKNEFKRPDNCVAQMTEILLRNGVDPSIKLAAALNMCFLTTDTSVLFVASKYLKESYKDSSPRDDNQRFSKHDILLGLGKIFYVGDFPAKAERSSDLSSVSKSSTLRKECSSIPDDISNEGVSGKFATAESVKADGKLSADEYEVVIDKLLDDISDDRQDFLVTEFDKMKDRGLIMKLITKPEFVNLKYSADLLFNNRHNDEVLATMVTKCDPDPSQCKKLITLADSLLIEGSSTNIVVTIVKILAHSKEDWDQELLSLAYTALLYDKLDIFPLIISKCKDINSYMNNNDTFVTFIIKQSLTEEEIIEAIKLGKFDINKPNKDGVTPIFLTSKKKLDIVFEFLCEKGANLRDLHYNDR